VLFGLVLATPTVMQPNPAPIVPAEGIGRATRDKLTGAVTARWGVGTCHDLERNRTGKGESGVGISKNRAGIGTEDVGE